MFKSPGTRIRVKLKLLSIFQRLEIFIMYGYGMYSHRSIDGLQQPNRNPQPDRIINQFLAHSSYYILLNIPI